MTDPLASRYRALLRLYPSRYREERGEEILATYLDAAPHGRTRPGLRDTVDVAVGAARQWCRGLTVGSSAEGLRAAATLALTTGVTLAAIWLLWIELVPIREGQLVQTPFGPFQTVAGVTWTVWVVAAVIAAIRPGRLTRTAVGTALCVTVAAIPVSTLFEAATPDIRELLVQAAFGVVALAVPDRPGRIARCLPVVAVGVVAAVAAAVRSWRVPASYHSLPQMETVFGTAAVLLGIAVAVTVMRRPGIGAWTVFFLLCPGLVLVTSRPDQALAVDLVTGETEPDTRMFDQGLAFATIIGISLAIMVVAAIRAELRSARRRRRSRPVLLPGHGHRGRPGRHSTAVDRER